MTTQELFKQEILKTLSFFDEKCKEEIFVELDPKLMRTNFANMTNEDLDFVLNELIQEKKIARIKRDNDELVWLRKMPPRKTLFIDKIRDFKRKLLGEA